MASHQALPLDRSWRVKEPDSQTIGGEGGGDGLSRWETAANLGVRSPTRLSSTSSRTGRLRGRCPWITWCGTSTSLQAIPKRGLCEWRRSKHMQENDRVAYEMRCLAQRLYAAGCYDQLNLSSLCSMEVVGRQLQAIVDGYAAGSPENPDWVAARVITAYKDDAISPSLRSWLGCMEEQGGGRSCAIPRSGQGSDEGTVRPG